MNVFFLYISLVYVVVVFFVSKLKITLTEIHRKHIYTYR